MLSNPRRQNSSCDQCRRSKKKCAFLSEGSRCTDTKCCNCQRLGHKCTFDFATSHARSTERKRRMSALTTETAPRSKQRSGIQESSNALTSFQDESPTQFTEVTSIEHDSIFDEMLFDDPSLDGFILSNPDSGDCFTEAKNIENQTMPSVMEANDLADDSFTEMIPANTSNYPYGAQPCDRECIVVDANSHATRPQDAVKFTNWSLDSGQLLKSGIVNEYLKKDLRCTFDTLLASLADRYLSYDCNIFAIGDRYQISTGTNPAWSIPSTPTNGSLLTVCQNHKSAIGDNNPRFSSIQQNSRDWMVPTWLSNTSKSKPSTQTVSVIGAARFLDNFGALYGNRLHAATRKLHEQALAAVAQAFALQTRGADYGTQAEYQAVSCDYQNAWREAYACFEKSQHSRSFLYIFAVLMFQMIPPPGEQAENIILGAGTLVLVDQTLNDVQILLHDVETFYMSLQSDSRYRKSLELSASMMRWVAYVRDTVIAFSLGRNCCMADVSRNDGIRPPRVSVTADDLDEKIPSMAQQAGQMLFMFYRRIIALRKIIQQRTDIGGSSEFVEIESTISALRGFQNNHREWINMGITALPELSVRSRQFVCFISLFWNHGVLCAIELVQECSSASDNTFTLPENREIMELQHTAVIQTAAVSEWMADTHSTRLPLIAHHANTQLVVSVLVKAIEHAVMYVNICGTPVDRQGEPVSIGCLVHPLLACLNALNLSITGHTVVQSALQMLMYKYGDILMEHWYFNA